ncbi:MAG: thermonuclease family protein [Acidobacteria bacterium]|nr:thermonuclease family protein [Acidobacteriota bacterium]
MRWLLLLLLLSCSDPVAAAGESYRVTRIADGDTLTVQSERGPERIRFLGIDAPEMNWGKGRPDCGAVESRDAVRRLVEGKRVRIERRGTDDYGRTLAIVHLEKAPQGMAALERTSVNEWLLHQGHAELFRKAVHPDRERFRQAEQQARIAKRGMWRCREQ